MPSREISRSNECSEHGERSALRRLLRHPILLRGQLLVRMQVVAQGSRAVQHQGSDEFSEL
jgi:hypothetical protein